MPEPVQRVIVLSPHRDDAAFSCGLLIGALLRADVPVTIVNVCTVSDYAPFAAPGSVGGVDEVGAVTKLRGEEDDLFCAEMFASARGDAKNAADSLEMIDLAWLDAPLRLAMPTPDVLERGPLAADIARLAEEFRQWPLPLAVLSPAGLGGHIDHLMVHAAARQCWEGTRLLFYEDLPYACGMSKAQLREEIARCAGESVATYSGGAGAAAGAKRQYANCYPSQIEPSLADVMEEYAAGQGGTERFYARRDADVSALVAAGVLTGIDSEKLYTRGAA